MNRRVKIGQLANAKILVRTPNWIGDAVMCLPALRELRRALPEADLTLVARAWVRDVFPIEELRCRILAYDTRGSQSGFTGRWHFASGLRRENYTAAILFQNAFDAAVLALLAGIPIRAGYARHARRALLTHPVKAPRRGEVPPHETYYYLELLRRLELIPRLPEVNQISLPAPEADRNAAKLRLRRLIAQTSSPANGTMPGGLTVLSPGHDRTPLVGISAGASFGTAKRWPPERFAELAVRLNREREATTVFFGSKEEAPLVDSAVAIAGPGAISLAGKTSLREFIQLVPGCDLYVTNDTGTMHLAAALGVPTLALFGPTDECGTRPLGAHARVLAGEAACRPCKLRHCPIDHRCMTSLAVEAVLDSARIMLSESRPLENDSAGEDSATGAAILQKDRVSG